VSLEDTVTVTRQTCGVTAVCQHLDVPIDTRNIVRKAARAFFAHTGIAGGCHIVVQKTIPTQAGLGGGSADAAATLRALNELYEAALSADELCAIGLRCGADVPFCVRGGTALAEGVGEKLTALPTPEGYAVILKPSVGISTVEAYAQYDAAGDVPHPDTVGCLEAVRAGDIRAVAACCGNVFEYLPLPEEIGQAAQKLLEQGALVAQMSGSGSAVFGLFAARAAAEAAAAAVGGMLCRFVPACM
jgi:4-diphosphocytidyl-2-C-methyl-D-erythritol kinase